jgi:hypothetical protein
VAAAAEANVPFSFPFSFSFSYLNFRLFLVGFSIDVDSPRSLVRSFDCWTFAFQSGEKRTKRKTNKAPDCSNVVHRLNWSTNKLVVDSFNFRTR